ncbi:MAG: hypothetical protein EBQ66_01785 [Flavobacteriia bacterium]|nr:hypothetical protein [Flavobacteriia bacterium]
MDRMSSSAGAPIPDFQLPYTAYGYAGQNGRVNLNSVPNAGGASVSNGVPDSAGFSFPKQTEVNFASDMLRGNWDHTALSDAFFTRKNVDIIQLEIQKEVYRISGPKKWAIGPQDVDEIKMIMRAMYLQYAKNNPFNIEGQLEELNQLVIKWSIPRIMSEIEQYNYYLNDISHLPIPLQQPMSMSSAGTKSLPFQPQM